MIAPNSKTLIGAPPPAGASSTIAGMRLFGPILRNASVN